MSEPEQRVSADTGTLPEVPTAAGQAAASPNRFVQLFARLTLTQLTLIVVVAVFLWQWLDARYQLDQTQQAVARRLAEVEAANKASQMLLAQNQEMVRELGGKLGLLESRFAETQNQRAALESLYQEMSGSRDQMALAEVEQMLLIAGQQLQLSSNVKAALIALQQAESRLQRPAFAGLKKHVDQDIARLRALPSIDAPAINQALDSVIGAVDSLPLIQDAHPLPAPGGAEPAPADSAWKRFWRELWQEVKGLVRIENTAHTEMPLLPPSQTYFLRENLKLRLLSARMALLTRDDVSFRRELKTSQDWLKRYFDTRSGASVQALAALQKLATADIAIDLPDISDSLDAVRNYRLSHERSSR